MSNTALPKQIGYLTHSNTQQSTVVIGKDVTVGFEAFGFGPQGRPDILEKATINLTFYSNNNPSKIATISLNAADVATIITNNPNAKNIQLTLQEVDVCVGTAAKKCIILASAPYDPA